MKSNAVVVQSGGCTAVINQSLAGIVAAVDTSKKIGAVWGSRHGIEGVLSSAFVNLRQQPAALMKTIAHSPSAALGSSRHKLRDGDAAHAIEKLKKRHVRHVFLIGGNDTAVTSLQLAKAAQHAHYDLNIIHIPKTIDNDLMETDHCPGYGSVARFAAITTQEAALDTKAMRRVDPVKIVELMGRNSGWIVAASALMKRSPKDAPHILWVPEVAFRKDVFVRQVEATLASVGYCIVVISETIRDAQGNRIGSKTDGIISDPFGHRYVEGTAARLASTIEKDLGVRARFDKPGTIQRMSMAYVSKVDQQEAFQAGVHAVRWSLRGISEVMVGFERKAGTKYRIRYRPVPLSMIPNNERYLPTNFFDGKIGMVKPAFTRYALPLIGGNLPEFASF